MFTIRYVPEILHGLGDGTIAFGSEGSEFDTQEEAETFLSCFLKLLFAAHLIGALKKKHKIHQSRNSGNQHLP